MSRRFVFNPLAGCFDIIEVSTGSDSFVPLFIASGFTFTVPQYKQALFGTPIDVEGVLNIDGMLIEVT